MATTGNRDIQTPQYTVSGEFKRLLAECRMSQRRFGEIADVHPNTVTQWIKTDSVPHLALKYLRLYRDVKGLADRG